MNADEKAIADAERAGFDLSLVDLNLSLTPEERVLQHAAALQLALKLEAAGVPLRLEQDIITIHDLRAIAARRGVRV